MNREIKFRARSSGKMLYSDKPGHFILKWQNEAQITDGLWLSYDEDGESGGKGGTSENHPTLMQYTGLKDKNGKHDIYEGDILRDSEGLGVGAVEYLPDAARFVVAGNHGIESGLIYQHWTVIGNIYENPELLENNNE